MTDVTHEVFNQPEPLVGYNLFETHRPLQDALRFNAPGLDPAPLRELGALAGSADMQQHARLANVHTPGCAATIASATASTRWSSIPATTC